MRIVNIISQLFSVIFLAVLIHATVQAGSYGFAAALAVVFLFVVKQYKFKITKSSIEAEHDES